MAATNARQLQAADENPRVIVHGDARTALLDIEAESVACVITSPPFWDGAEAGHSWGAGAIGGESTPAAYLDALVDLCAAVRWTLTPTGTVWLVLGEGSGTLGTEVGLPWAVLRDLARDGWHVATASAWDASVVAQLHRTPDHLPLSALPPYEAIITDQPYAPLSRRSIRRCVHVSTREGDLILDPCCGSGTVGIVAGEEKRRFIGIEVDKATCHLARARVGGYKVTVATEKAI